MRCSRVPFKEIRFQNPLPERKIQVILFNIKQLEVAPYSISVICNRHDDIIVSHVSVYTAGMAGTYINYIGGVRVEYDIDEDRFNLFTPGIGVANWGNIEKYLSGRVYDIVAGHASGVI